MLMNAVETAMMNNPVRAALQRFVEMPMLIKMGGTLTGERVLEVGCGRGVGASLILESCTARVDAFDLDARMVERARRRLRRHGERVRVKVGDVERIDAEDGAYDTVFDFGIIHHVPNWRNALREIYRVLKPGGRLYAEEVLEKFILDPLWRRLLVHPLKDRFDHAGFCAGLQGAGFELIASRELWGQFAWFAARRPLREAPVQTTTARMEAAP